jgi:hypothetical protein
MQSDLLQQNPSLSAGTEDQKAKKAEKAEDEQEHPALAAAPRKRHRLDLPTEKLWSSIQGVQQG